MATEKLVFKIDAETNKAVKNVEQLEDAIDQLKQQLQGEDFGTAEFSRLQGELVRATKAMKDFELSVEALDAEQMASEFGSFAQGVGDITTGAFAMANAMGLAGSSAEDSLNTLVSGIAIANAFRGGIEGIISMQKLLKSSTIATTVATNGGSVAMRLFNLVVAANPIFLLIAAIGAVVGAFALFGGASDAAKEKQAALNAELENSSRAADNAAEAYDRLAARQTQDLDNSSKLLAKERDLLQAKSKRTEAEEKRLRAINEQLNGIELSKFDAAISGSGSAIKDLGKVVNDNFNLIKSSIDVTDIEDGVNDIDYSALIGKNTSLQSSFKQIMKAGFSPENIADQLGNLEQLRKMVGNYQASLEKKKLGMGAAEAEEFDKVIENADKLAGNLDKVISKADNYNAALGDKSTTKNLQDQDKTLEQIQAKEEAAKKAAEARTKAIERQKQLKEQLLKLEQDIELLKIEDDEQRAVKAIEIRLKNETAAVVGKSKEAIAVRAKLEEKAQLEIQDVRDEYQKKKETKDAEEKQKEIEREDEQFKLLNLLRENEQQKEITALVEDYEEKYALANGNAELETALIEQQKKDIAAINKKYKDKEAEDNKEAADKAKAEREKEVQSYLKMLNEMKSIFASIKAEGNALGVDLMTNTLGAIASFVSLANQEFDNLADKVAAYTQAIGGVVQGFINAFADASKAKTKERLDDLQNATNEEKAMLQSKYDSGLISKEEFDKSNIALEKSAKNQELAIKKKAFESEKKSKIATATVAGITGAVSAFAGAMQLGPIAGPIVGGVLAAAVGVLTGLNISKIKQTQFEGGAGGGGASSGVSAPSPAALNNSTLFSTGGDPSKLVGSKQNQESPALLVKAVVVESDVTNAQNKVSAMESRATL
jgi:hypothetical protein